MSSEPHIWEQLHDLKHVNHDFEQVSSNFVYPDSYNEIFDWNNTNTYQESIQMFIAIASVCGVFGILFISVFAFCCNYVRSNEIESEYDNTVAVSEMGYQHVESSQQAVQNVTNSLSKFAKFARYFISFLIFVAIILSFIFAFVLDSTIKDVENTMDNSYQPYKLVINDGYAINSTLSDAIIQCHNIETELRKDDSNSNEEIANYIGNISQSLSYGQSEIDNFLDSADNVNWENSGEALDSHREQIFYTCIALTCFIFVIVIISICTSEKITACNGIVSVLVTLGMIILWIIGSVQFGISVELADICNDPNNAVIQAINHTSFDSSNNETAAIIKYYVYCDIEHNNNPLISYCTQAYETIFALNSTMTLLVIAAQDTSYQTSVNELYVDYNDSLYELIDLNSSLNCGNIHSYYSDLSQDMCYDLLDEWYTLYVLQFIVVGFLLLRLCFTCRTSVTRKAAQYVVDHRNHGPYRDYHEDPVELGHDTQHGTDRYAL